MSRSVMVKRADGPEEMVLRCLRLSARRCADVATRAMALSVGPEQVAVAWGLIDEEDFYRELAGLLGLGFLTEPFAVDSYFISPQGAAAGMTRRVDGRVIVAPQGEALRRLLADRPAGCLMTSPAVLRESLRLSRRSSSAFSAAAAIAIGSPGETAQRDGGAGGFVVAAWLVSLVSLAFYDPLSALPVTLPLWLLFAWTIGQRIMAIAMHRDTPERAPARALAPFALPTYSVLVPLYREDRVLAQLVNALAGLDYPPEKIEILFLVEEDDRTTREAFARFALSPQMRVVLCPNGVPRTKPRALNIGLQEARGEFVAVFDAEDIPEPDQLAKAAALFRASPHNVACLQAEIAIANAETNFWTRGFALEYAALFQIVVPGLCGLGLPVALGGTSNHFRRDVLLTLNGWDAWNVTEDADLGLRLALHGYRVASLDSRTWEDPPDDPHIWRQQRIRWIKGWMQTSLVHLRETWRRWHVLSFFGKCGVLHHLVGTPVASLLTPLFAVALCVGLVSGETDFVHQGTIALGFALACASTLMMIALLLHTKPQMSAQARRQAIVSYPLYLLLVCCCAWLALAELVRAPFHWNKTPHGAALPQPAAELARARAKRKTRRDDFRRKAMPVLRNAQAPPRL